MSLTERDYQYRDFCIRHYVLENEQKNLVLHCNYLDRNQPKLILHNVYAYNALEILQNHAIDYIIRSYDSEAGTHRFEIHFKQLYEVTNVWAEKLLQTE